MVDRWVDSGRCSILMGDLGELETLMVDWVVLPFLCWDWGDDAATGHRSVETDVETTGRRFIGAAGGCGTYRTGRRGIKPALRFKVSNGGGLVKT